MARRMLILLEEYDYTKIAIEYGTELAIDNRWELTGLSILDLPSIEKSIGPVPAGASHFALKQIEKRKQEELQLAQTVIAEFESICAQKEVPYTSLRLEGSPTDIIIEQSQFHDLVIAGWQTSFRYGQEPDSDLQYAVISHGICPFLLIPQYHRRVQKILLCYDGKTASTKAIHQFIQFNVYRDSQITLLTVNDHREAGERLLQSMNAYLKAAAVRAETVCLPGHASDVIADFVNDQDIDLIVLGAHGQSRISKFFFGSTAQTLITHANRPIFVYH